MAESWFLLESGAQPGALNMAWDEALLEGVTRLGRPVLRFYGWTEPAATFGYSQRYATVATLTPLRPLLRRPTGGGLVPHDGEWTYSVTFPPSHPWHRLKARESYQRIHECLQEAFAVLGLTTQLSPARPTEPPGQCFVRAVENDLVLGSCKLAGAAQRRTREGLLIQGSVQPGKIAIDRQAWQTAVCRTLAAQFGVVCEPLKPPLWLVARAAALARIRYSQKDYNQRR